MFIYWLIIVITIVKVMEFVEKIKDKRFLNFSVDIKKKKKNSIPSEIKYL